MCSNWASRSAWLLPSRVLRLACQAEAELVQQPTDQLVADAAASAQSFCQVTSLALARQQGRCPGRRGSPRPPGPAMLRQQASSPSSQHVNAETTYSPHAGRRRVASPSDHGRLCRRQRSCHTDVAALCRPPASSFLAQRDNRQARSSKKRRQALQTGPDCNVDHQLDANATPASRARPAIEVRSLQIPGRADWHRGQSRLASSQV